MRKIDAPEKFSFADDLLLAICTTLESYKDQDVPGLALIRVTESPQFTQSRARVELTAHLLLLTLFGKEMYTRTSATALQRRLLAIDGGDLVSLIEAYVSIPYQISQAFTVQRDSYDDLTTILFDLSLMVLNKTISFGSLRRQAELEPAQTPLQLHIEVTEKYQSEYMEILKPFYDMARTRPELIPILRDTARELSNKQYRDDPFPPKQYDLVRQDIEALLDAVEAGEIG